MNDTLKYKYVKFPQIRLKLKNTPIGTMARRYTRPVILTVLRPSRRVVVRAITCVMTVAKTRCHAVRRIGYSKVEVSGRNEAYRARDDVLKWRVDKIHLLNRMTLELSEIQTLGTRS
jgi:hypothetical protein